MIVRELLAVFGLDYDKTGQRKAEKGLDTLKRQSEGLAASFGAIFQAAAVATPFFFLSKLASDAQEDLNLMGVVFEDSADDVRQWAEGISASVGQSRFDLQGLAASMGGLLAAMIGPGERAADMSTKLTELAVDLSSIYRTQLPRTKDALIVLRSAMTGETEAIKRFGADLTESAIKAEALAMGLGSNTKALTKTQKAQIRYNILMRDLAFVQGDAAKTVDQYAGSIEALKGGLKDIGTDIGLFFMPSIEAALKAIRGLVSGPLKNAAKDFTQWAQSTELASAALMGLALIVGAALLPVLFTLAKLMLGFAVFAVIMDDVISTFKGQESLLGSLTKMLDTLEKEGFPGMSKAAEAVIQVFNRFRDVLGASAAAVWALIESITSGNLNILKRQLMVLGDSFKSWFDVMGKWGEGILLIIDGMVSGLSSVAGLIEGIVRSIASGEVSHLRNALMAVASTGADLGARGGTLLSGGRSGITGGLMSRTVQVNQGGQTVNITVQQQPGEAPQDFVDRVADVIEQKQAERDQAIYSELVPTAAGAQ